MKAGEKCVIRVDIRCPFCTNTAGRWKIIPSVWRWSKVDGPKDRPPQLGLEAIDEKRAMEFERTALQKHFIDCTMYGSASDIVKQIYSPVV